MLRVGLTGGLGSGKSTVAGFLRSLGAEVVEADTLGRQMMEPGQPIFDQIVREFGKEVLSPDGRLNRAQLAKLAFQGGRIHQLNAIIHPAVIEAQRQWMEEVFVRNASAVAVVESALIFEVVRDAQARGEQEGVLADWRRRYPLAVSFLATMAILAAASEWYLPHWIPRFWRAIHEYQHYTGASSVMDKFMGAPWSWAFGLLAFAATMGVCWRERRQPANSGAVAFTFSLVLATTVLIIPSLANYNQVLLIPALLVVAKESQTIWRESVPNRALFVVTICLIFWPWIASVVLAGLSFVLAPETVERGWAIPFWTAIQIPVGVAALMLVHYYQKTFTASAGRSTS